MDMMSSRLYNSTQVSSTTSTFSSSSNGTSTNSIKKPSKKSSATHNSQNAIFNKGSPFVKKGNQGASSRSLNGTLSYTPSFLSSETKLSQSNPMFQYYYLKNQSAIPVSIMLRNQHISDKTRRRQWQNHKTSIFKSTLEIYYEEEILHSLPNQQLPAPIKRQTSDVSALSSIESDETFADQENGEVERTVFRSSSSRLNKPGHQYRVIYSKEHEASFHSCWNHLSDVLQSLQTDVKTGVGKTDWFQDSRYLSMKARVYISNHELQRIYNFQHLHEDHEESHSFDKQPDNDYPTKEHNNQNKIDLNSLHPNLESDSTLTIATIPLHPTHLRCLPPSSTNSTLPAATYSSPLISSIPSSLPPNSLIVKYSDDSLRIIPPLYKLLLKNNIISEKSFDVEGTDSKEKLEADRINENKRTIRFSDDAFRALQVSEKKESSSTNGMTILHRNHKSSKISKRFQRQGSGIHNEDNVFSLLGDITAPEKNNSLEDDIMHKTQNIDLVNGVFDNVWRDLQPERDRIENHREMEIPISLVDNVQDMESQHEDTLLLRDEPDQRDFHDHEFNTDMDLSTDDDNGIKKSLQFLDGYKYNKELENKKIRILRDKVSQLERNIVSEEAALKIEEQQLEDSAGELKTLLREIQEIEKKSTLIKAEIKDMTEKFSKSEFLLSTRQSKLMKDLSQIYPIKRLSSNRFAICNLEIPTDLTTLFHSSAYDDAHISSALGYTAHLVFMCSKYLSTPLKYRLICNVSRSGVQGGQNGNLYPLFKDKVEKQEFDMAVTLLDRNVDCLIFSGKWSLDLDITKRMNMLEKLKKLFMRVMLMDYKSEPTNKSDAGS